MKANYGFVRLFVVAGLMTLSPLQVLANEPTGQALQCVNSVGGRMVNIEVTTSDGPLKLRISAAMKAKIDDELPGMVDELLAASQSDAVYLKRTVDKVLSRVGELDDGLKRIFDANPVAKMSGPYSGMQLIDGAVNEKGEINQAATAQAVATTVEEVSNPKLSGLQAIIAKFTGASDANDKTLSGLAEVLERYDALTNRSVEDLRDKTSLWGRLKSLVSRTMDRDAAESESIQRDIERIKTVIDHDIIALGQMRQGSEETIEILTEIIATKRQQVYWTNALIAEIQKRISEIKNEDPEGAKNLERQFLTRSIRELASLLQDIQAKQTQIQMLEGIIDSISERIEQNRLVVGMHLHAVAINSIQATIQAKTAASEKVGDRIRALGESAANTAVALADHNAGAAERNADKQIAEVKGTMTRAKLLEDIRKKADASRKAADAKLLGLAKELAESVGMSEGEQVSADVADTVLALSHSGNASELGQVIDVESIEIAPEALSKSNDSERVTVTVPRPAPQPQRRR